jgi:integration host factor subunit beta
MVKSEIIECIANQQQMLSPKDVELGVKNILDHMSDELSKGNRIEVRGFGTFCLHRRPPRKAHNPKTGEEVATLERYIPHFKAGKELRNRINHRGKAPLLNSKDNHEEYEDDTL